MTRPTPTDDADVFFSPSAARVAASLSSSSASSSSTSAREPPARPRPAPALEVSRRASASASPARLPRTSSLLPPPRVVAEAAAASAHAPADVDRPLTPADREGTDTKIPFLSLPPILPLPSLEEGSEGRPSSLEVLPGGEASDRDTSGPSPDPIRPATSHTLYRMPYDQGRDGYADRSRSRSRNGKGSVDLTKPKAAKPPSQKAMLSRALQKANTAVQLDNAQNFEGARLAYAEACDLLQQVLLRTSGDDDQKKLEAIRRTYASRIDELDQMGPYISADTNKALPARPESNEYQPSIEREDEDDDIAIIGTASTINYARDESSHSPVLHRTGTSPPTESRDGRLRDASQERLRNTTSPQNPPLHSAFSRSPARLRQRQSESVPQPLATFRAPSPAKPHSDGLDETLPQERSYTPGSWGEPPESGTHGRDGSQNSWLDPIDESGGSSGSSVHSRTSSLGYRRKHLRGTSGNTENEFDTALDAAIEAAYDDGYEPMASDNAEAEDAGDEIVNKVLRKVELARERVRQTEREAYGTEQPRRQPPYPDRQETSAGFYDDDSSEEEERMLEEMTRGYGIEDFIVSQDRKQSVSRPESRGVAGAHRKTPSDPDKPLPPIDKLGPRAPVSKNLMPSAPPPMHSLPELPAQRSSSSQSVRNRRLSGQNPKQLKIETSKLRPPPAAVQEADAPTAAADAARTAEAKRLEESPPTATFAPAEGMALGLRKNFSSSSLRSMKSRNVSLSNLDDASDRSPGTPSSNTPFSSLRAAAPAVPALPTPLSSTFRENVDGSATGGLHLFEDNFHLPTSPGSPNPMSLDAPTMVHPRGGYLSTKLFVPRDVWKVKGVKLKYVEDKIANCDYLTAALLKLAKVDTCDADAVLEEMQSLEGVLEQSSGSLFREASNVVEGDGSSNMPRTASISGKSSSFSKLSSIDGAKEVREVGLAQFSGPNAHYMGSLARLFDAAQAVDQIARQVEDPGLRHADKTQVGLELCTRHAAEFFGFYICRFVLTDVSLLLDKFIKRGSEWMSRAWTAATAWTRRCLAPGTARCPGLLRRAYASQPPPKPSPKELEARIAAIPIQRYRNFCIVAHIDHGKSTLSDRLLELTGTISASDANKQILDKLDVERERGITVKAQTCTMIYQHGGRDYLLHLVDTPGHVDFRAEVTRSYASCGGALLLIDASQGIQAQTVSNFHLAFAQDLALVPVINKIDMPSADVPAVLDQMETSFELDPKDAVLVSAKTGKGVPDVLPAVVEKMPHPVGDENAPLKFLLVDSWYDNFKGVVLLVRVFDGAIRAGDSVVSLGTGMKYTVGQVGYVFFNPGMKRIQDAKLGDTFTTVGAEDRSDYHRLADSIGQLALGSGWRLGFLGSLHCSVFQDRLRQEHGRSIIITEPTNPALFPDAGDHRIRSAELFEPFVKATITLPQEYLGRVIELCEANRGEQKSLEFFHGDQVILVYDIPAAQLVEDLFGKLKGATKGYATLDYEDAGWRQSKLVKIQLLVNKQPVDAICRVVHASQADRIGRHWVTKFKEHVDRQMFEVVIQAIVGNKIIARETIKPFRKDVLAKLHASDITRRRKLLEKQKEGRKRLRAVGNVVIDQSAFQSFLSK
ncbi:Translation factor GUF1 [Purpureocillium lavendulum]|uniref:Translation factor GUF1 n=1 Tax=Purpureocillium lavendulum TaxID=1247861 RepID=A0AB34FWN3_9HYPO|nr:Translation factor GUF1 [Purpureocillium lavendulum]